MKEYKKIGLEKALQLFYFNLLLDYEELAEKEGTELRGKHRRKNFPKGYDLVKMINEMKKVFLSLPKTRRLQSSKARYFILKKILPKILEAERTPEIFNENIELNWSSYLFLDNQESLRDLILEIIAFYYGCSSETIKKEYYLNNPHFS